MHEQANQSIIPRAQLSTELSTEGIFFTHRVTLLLRNRYGHFHKLLLHRTILELSPDV